MKCRDLKNGFEHYADGELPEEEMAQLTGHLDVCPLCRDELARIQTVRQGLRNMSRPKMSDNMLRNLRQTISSEVRPAVASPTFRLIGANSGSWFEVWLMPTTAGAVGAAVLGVALLAILLIPSNVPDLTINTNQNISSSDSIFLASIDGTEITPLQYAHSRSDISSESPSVNPGGALVALTNSIASGEMKDEEVVVVADVYGDGLARITDVVEASRDRNTMDMVQKAFQTDRGSAPFVPASMDNRGETIRVVLKLQSVNVNINEGDSFR